MCLKSLYRYFRGFWAALALSLLVAFAVVSSKTGRLRFVDGRLGLQLSSAAVFTHYNRVWSQPVTLVKVGGSTAWVEVTHSDLTPLGIAGYRQRWDRLIWEADRKRAPENLWVRAAAFTADRWAQAHPAGEPVAEVRLVKVLRRAGDPAMDVPQGRWDLPPVASLPAKDVVELALCRRVDEQWVLAPKKRSEPAEVDEGTDEDAAPAKMRPLVRIPSLPGGSTGSVRPGKGAQKPSGIRPAAPGPPWGATPPRAAAPTSPSASGSPIRSERKRAAASAPRSVGPKRWRTSKTSAARACLASQNQMPRARFAKRGAARSQVSGRCTTETPLVLTTAGMRVSCWKMEGTTLDED
jgi:hypothetical protein